VCRVTKINKYEQQQQKKGKNNLRNNEPIGLYNKGIKFPANVYLLNVLLINAYKRSLIQKSSSKVADKHSTVPLPAVPIVPTMIKVTEICPRHYYEGNFRSGKSDCVSRLCRFL
jgi:hypothetical protein